jgi:hypothetical protein
MIDSLVDKIPGGMAAYGGEPFSDFIGFDFGLPVFELDAIL